MGKPRSGDFASHITDSTLVTTGVRWVRAKFEQFNVTLAMDMLLCYILKLIKAYIHLCFYKI